MTKWKIFVIWNDSKCTTLDGWIDLRLNSFSGLSLGDYLFISAKFLSSKHSFEDCKQKKSLGARSGEYGG
jgi:hypothetical protein